MVRLRWAVVAIMITACGGAGGGGAADAAPPDGADAPDDPCVGRPLCERFDGLPPGPVADGATVGPYRAQVVPGGTLAIDGTHAFSGSQALHAHIDGGSAGGGRLFATGGALFAPTQRHLYGRFMMWNATDASSVHWTLTGASGVIPDGPSAGHTATYLWSAAEDKRWMAVFYDDQTAQDCWHHAAEPIPVGTWTCVAFEADAEQLRYRLSLDGRAITSFDVDTTGQGCLNAPGDTPWYGPSFERLYLGAVSFHPMSGPLDVWYDDLIVDTVPVACP
ncbi:MAG: hypothetical protein R3B06_01270 [Kofleriaceae bacterium]